MEDFRCYVRERAKMYGINDKNIYNADQTAVFFSPDSKYTYEAVGKKTISVKDIDNKNRCSVMLCASKTGEKIPPYIVFKGSNGRGGRIRQELEARVGYPDGVELMVQPKAWFNEEIMIDWIERVWKPFAVRDTDKLCYLLIDEFPGHMTTAVKEAFDNCKTIIDYIPGGFTDRLQVMDVGINKPFKDFFADRFDSWLNENYTVPTANPPKPLRRNVALWVDIAWNSIMRETILKTWRRAMGDEAEPEDAEIEAIMQG
jgi:hypothetical protein